MRWGNELTCSSVIDTQCRLSPQQRFQIRNTQVQRVSCEIVSACLCSHSPRMIPSSRLATLSSTHHVTDLFSYVIRTTTTGSYHCFSLVSNEVPEQPVLSPVSGCIYEKRLIIKYLHDSRTDPVNGQPLTEEQLIDVKGRLFTLPVPPPLTELSSHTVGKTKATIGDQYSCYTENASRRMGWLHATQLHTPSTVTNSASRFVDDADELTNRFAFVIEIELSHVMYQHDAACRVIARLNKEVTAAREALATLKPQAGIAQAAPMVRRIAFTNTKRDDRFALSTSNSMSMNKPLESRIMPQLVTWVKDRLKE